MRHIQIVRSKRRIPRQEEQGKLLSKQSWSITRFVGSLAAIDVHPILSSASVWSPIPYPEEIGREE
ncbi:hypothetical protein R4K57_22205, partial [Xanthomonas hortorum pv. vitians]|nr:hypothetical protein [Xanthomonas hortorum pv. vitians]